MRRVLIGARGLVGKSIASKLAFDSLQTSTSPCEDTFFDLAVIAAPGAEKWKANLDPASDLEQVTRLISRLDSMSLGRVIHMSTVDVYANPNSSDEDSDLTDSNSPYGFHRRLLEEFLISRFTDVKIYRLGGLVGDDLKKNAVYDMKNKNRLEAISPSSTMQFFPLRRLHEFVSSESEGMGPVVNLTAPPMALGQIAAMAHVDLNPQAPSVHYDVRSKFFESGYSVDLEDSLSAIGDYFA